MRFGGTFIKCLKICTYLLHPPHACITGRGERAVKEYGAGEALVPNFGRTPAKQPGGRGNAKNGW
jgi:hypothetical protein